MNWKRENAEFLRDLVSLIGTSLVAAVIIAPPAIYFAIGHYYESEASISHAARVAFKVGRQLDLDKSLTWADIKSQRAMGDWPGMHSGIAIETLLDPDGRADPRKKQLAKWPTLTSRAPVHARGGIVGHVEITSSLRPLLLITGLVTILSNVLGFVMNWLVRVLPLTALESAMVRLKGRERNLEAQNERFDAALSNMRQGLSMFDREGRLEVCNSRFAEMYGLASGLIIPGTTLLQIIENRVAAGLFPKSCLDDIKALGNSKGDVSRIVTLGDGRMIQIRYQGRPEGGCVVTHEDITAKRLTEARIKEADLELVRQREVIDQVASVSMTDCDGLITYVNDKFCKLTGYSREELLGKTHGILNSHYHPPELWHEMSLKLKAGEIWRREICNRAKDGQLYWIDTTIVPRFDPTGKLNSFMSVRYDISAQKAAQAELLASQRQAQDVAAKLEAVMTNMAEGVCMVDAEHRVIVTNKSYTELYGLSPEDVAPGTPIRQIIVKHVELGLYSCRDPDASLAEWFPAVRLPGYEVVKLNDNRIIAISRRPLANGGWVTTHLDVSEREKLKEHLEIALGNMAHGLILFDSANRLTVFNQQYIRMFGLSPDIVKRGCSFRDILVHRKETGSFGGDIDEYHENSRISLAQGQTVQKIVPTPDGRSIQITSKRLLDGGWVATLADITKLETLKHHLSTAMNTMTQGLVMFDPQGRLVLCNDRFAEMYAVPPELQKPGTPWMDIVRHRIAIGAFANNFGGDEHLKERMTIELSAYDKIEQMRDGRIISMFSRPLADGGWVKTHEDITERCLIEANAAEQNAINEMQRSFIAMASHEFRTPLAIIDSSAQKLKAHAAKMTPDDIIARSDILRNATRRILALMESILSVAKHDDGAFKISPSHCDPRKVLCACIERLREAGCAHEISVDLAQLPEGIIADGSALDQIFTNVLTNAVKYSPGTKPIEIVGRTVGHEILFDITDHGVGMDEEDVSQLFTRFFRAKTAFGTAGTGIGLYVVKLLTELHGGGVSVRSKKDLGTTFTVLLPIGGPSAVSTGIGEKVEINAAEADIHKAA